MREAIASGAVNPWQLGHNKFSDQRTSEIQHNHGRNLVNVHADLIGAVTSNYTTTQYWCNKTDKHENACNEIQNQGTICTHAGGIFAAIAAMEAQYITQGLSTDIEKLSEQQCLDCAYPAETDCNDKSSTPELCLAFGKTNAITTLSRYPYTAKN